VHCTALHCTALHCTALHCTALHCAALHCTALHCTALHYTTLHCTALWSDDSPGVPSVPLFSLQRVSHMNLTAIQILSIRSFIYFHSSRSASPLLPFPPSPLLPLLQSVLLPFPPADLPDVAGKSIPGPGENDLSGPVGPGGVNCQGIAAPGIYRIQRDLW
jgi:hypothetical protein